MPDTYTDRLALVKPEVGASRDSWGSKTNANWDTIDNLLYMAMPIGTIIDYAGPTPPSGWLVADGRALSRTVYSQLFAIIGVSFGAGDGSTTFLLPNLNGRSSVGPGSITDANGNTLSLSFSQRLGNLSEHILQAHLPNYAMTSDAAGVHSHGGFTALGANHTHTTDAQGSHAHDATAVAVGDHQHPYQTNQLGPATWSGPSTGYYSDFANMGWNTGPAGAHTHAISVAVDGLHAHNVNPSGNLQLGINADGSHTHQIFLGGSAAWFPVMQPIIVVTKIIYAGTQAAVRTMSMAAEASAPLHTIEGEATELLDIREELRQLRQLLATMRGPAQQRRIAAPLRGPH